MNNHDRIEIHMFLFNGRTSIQVNHFDDCVIKNTPSYIGVLSAFEKYNNSTVDTLMTSYDYGSVMHYEWNAFAINSSAPTIIPTFNASATIGQRVGLSPVDILEIQRYYGCVATTSSVTTATTSMVTPTSTRTTTTSTVSTTTTRTTTTSVTSSTSTRTTTIATTTSVTTRTITIDTTTSVTTIATTISVTTRTTTIATTTSVTTRTTTTAMTTSVTTRTTTTVTTRSTTTVTTMNVTPRNGAIRHAFLTPIQLSVDCLMSLIYFRSRLLW